MLRHCEADLRRELSKTQRQTEISADGNHHHGPPLKPIDINPHVKRVEELRHDGPSAPGSPKSARFSPRKTHVTNFINQCGGPAELIRRRSSPEPIRPLTDGTPSPHLQLNGIQISPPKSPKPRRRYRSQSPRFCIDESESDSDQQNKNVTSSTGRKTNGLNKKTEINGNVENSTKKMHRKSRNDTIDDVYNQNAVSTERERHRDNKTDMVSFNSVGKSNTDNYYCPQSEPLKRKVYSEKTLERLQKSLELESGNINHINILLCF